MTEAETGLRSSEDGGRGHEPRTRGSPWRLKRQGNEFSSRASSRSQPCLHLGFSPVEVILDF